MSTLSFLNIRSINHISRLLYSKGCAYSNFAGWWIHFFLNSSCRNSSYILLILIISFLNFLNDKVSIYKQIINKIIIKHIRHIQPTDHSTLSVAFFNSSIFSFVFSMFSWINSRLSFILSNCFRMISSCFSIYTIFDKIKATIVQNQTAKTTTKIIAINQYKTWISSAFLVFSCAFATSSCFSAVNIAQWFCNLFIVINAFIYLYVGRPFFLKSVIKRSILSFVISVLIQ